ncbi:MAG: hypothetical protein M5U14_11345 [Acidimicrobiia bacterium]|nr:hypothetical protein [Acidimicrobiia bacterium]
MDLGDLGPELLHGARRRRRRREQEVDTEGPALDALPDPGDVGGDVLGRVHRLAEHGEPAAVDHRHGDVLAVRERDHRVLDAQLVAELRPQGIVGHGVALLVDHRAHVAYHVVLPDGRNT